MPINNTNISTEDNNSTFDNSKLNMLDTNSTTIQPVKFLKTKVQMENNPNSDVLNDKEHINLQKQQNMLQSEENELKAIKNASGSSYVAPRMMKTKKELQANPNGDVLITKNERVYQKSPRQMARWGGWYVSKPTTNIDKQVESNTEPKIQPVYGKDYIYLQDIDENNDGKLNLNEANKHYRDGNGVAVVVPGKNVTAYRYPWEIFNKKQAGGFTSLEDYPVHGQVSINQENQHIFNGDYDFEMHGNSFSDDGIGGLRNFGALIGNWFATQGDKNMGKKFNIKYDYDGSQAEKGFIPPKNYKPY